MSLEHSHVPNNIHIPSIRVPPLVNTHLVAIQCGADIKNGDIINPYSDGYAQYLTYNCAVT